MSKRSILFVDDEPEVLSALKRIFHKKGYTVFTCSGGEECLNILLKNEVAVIVVDQRMPGMLGIDVLRKVRDISPDSVRVLLTGCFDTNLALEATNKGEIYRILEKPWNDLEIQIVISQCIEKYNLVKENQHFQAQLLEQEKARMVRAMIITLSHEINNPLSALAASIHILQKEFELKKVPEDYGDLLEGMRSSYQRIAELINKLRDVEEVKVTEYVQGEMMVDVDNSKYR